MDALKDISSYAATGAFLLYLFGYLALRFHLTALGVVTELGVFDERYFFAGAQFLVFLAAMIPALAMALPIVALIWVLWRRWPRAQKPAIGLLHRPALLCWTTIVLAVAAIRLWMGACLAVHDLPLSTERPSPAWL